MTRIWIAPASYRPTAEEFRAQDRVYNWVILVCLAYVAGYCLVKGAWWPVTLTAIVFLVGAAHGLRGRRTVARDERAEL
jgi:fatty acid desaturase